MSDFASAAMVRLIRRGLERQGLALPVLPATPAAHVPLAAKRALAEQIVQQHGPQALLRLGEAAWDAPDEPVSVALAMARDPMDLLDRWRRLEPFVHSRHRVVVAEASPARLVLHHVSRDRIRPPTMAEHLLVFGLLVALMERIGARGLRARFVGERAWRRREGAWHGERRLPSDLARWELGWQPEPVARRAPMVVPEDFCAAAQRLLAADPARRWTVDTLARELGTSGRSLQRRLAQDGSSFSHLLATARLGVSARLLAETAQQPAEIAYVCGFADQGHFSRAFKRYSALTPGRYREVFGVGGAGRADIQTSGVLSRK